MGYIHTVSITGDQSYLIEPILFAVAGGTASAYTAAISNFSLVDGVVVHIKFEVTNSSAATLNVNSTGAKALRYEGVALSAGALVPDRIYSFVCITDNSEQYWELLSDLSHEDRVELVNMMEAT